jgi:hypothetical protein
MTFATKAVPLGTSTITCKEIRQNHLPMPQSCVGVTRKITVPKVVGESLVQADATMAASGLQVADVITGFSQTVPLNLVMAQSPASGNTVAEGSTVTLAESLGPQPIVGSTGPAVMPTPMPATALCQPSELTVKAVGYDHGGSVLSLVLVATDVGESPCSVPAIASVALLTSDGAPFGIVGPGYGPPLISGFFELEAGAANGAAAITVISNWCGEPTPPTTAEVTFASIGAFGAPLDTKAIVPGIMCENASYPPGVLSPVQVALAPNS